MPNTATTRDFARELDAGVFDHLKDKAVVTYCTGGVRCEVLSSLMKQRGFQEVYQLDGGIVRYGEAFGDDGLWEGSLYLFDARMHQEFSDHTSDHRSMRTMRRSHEPVPQLRESRVSQTDPAMRRVRP